MALGVILLVILAIITGFLSGLLGIGGNLLAIPMTLFILKSAVGFSADNAMHFAVGSCVAVMVFTSSSAALAHYRHKNIDWQIFKSMIAYVCLGAILGAFIASSINGRLLERIFAIFLLVISLYMIFSRRKQNSGGETRPIPLWSRLIFGLIIGFKSGLLGIGGGTMIIPFLLLYNNPHKRVAGTTSVFSFTLALTAAIIYLIKGVGDDLHIAYAIGFLYLPVIIIMAPITMLTAQFGAKVSNKMPTNIFPIILNSIMIILSLVMLIT